MASTLLLAVGDLFSFAAGTCRDVGRALRGTASDLELSGEAVVCIIFIISGRRWQGAGAYALTVVARNFCSEFLGDYLPAPNATLGIE